MSAAPENPLALPLSALDEAWLVLRCSDHRLVHYPLRLMARERGANMLLSDVVRRLRCDRCGGPPSYVELTDNPTRNASGRAPDPTAWAVDLTGAVEEPR